MVPDIVLFPHCDLHLTKDGKTALYLQVARRGIDPNDRRRYRLVIVNTLDLDVKFFAPHKEVGTRLFALPVFDPGTGQVTATGSAPGVYLFRVQYLEPNPEPGKPPFHYIVGRLQVHKQILGWWFGNSSITTAKDTQFAHAQPSIYALFDELSSGADVVGDITGHNYVALSSSNSNVFTVDGDGRLQGHAVGQAKLSGTFLGKTGELTVRVVDYAAGDQVTLVPESVGEAARYNIVFVAEGFRDNDDDRELFNEAVTRAIGDQGIFGKPRHSPYPLLQDRFNVWRVYPPSQQHGLTCGFQINDQNVSGVLDAGYPMPYSRNVPAGSKPDPSKYTVAQLIRRVGLPPSDQNLADNVVTTWANRSLPGFDPTRVSAELITAWKNQKAAGLLEARDTFLGLRLGRRWADRVSEMGQDIQPPAQDAGSSQLEAFIARLYQFFDRGDDIELMPDPRRHPPQLLVDRADSDGADTSIMRYLWSLRSASDPNLGHEWVPEWIADPTSPPDKVNWKKKVKRSVGLVAIICNEDMDGGTNFAALSAIGVTVKSTRQFTGFEYVPDQGPRAVIRRTMPSRFEADFGIITDTLAHEFGHSFNLGDEFEKRNGDAPGMPPDDLEFDNLTQFSAVHMSTWPAPDRKIDPAKVKWLGLLRAELSSTLLQPSNPVTHPQFGSCVEVVLHTAHIGGWDKAKAEADAKGDVLNAYVSFVGIDGERQQLLPQKYPSGYFKPFPVVEIRLVTDTMVLGGSQGPVPFPAGTAVIIPRRHDDSSLRYVVEPKVRAYLNSNKFPLNSDPDNQHASNAVDEPVSIAGFDLPCRGIHRVVGVYEGAYLGSGLVYRPSGHCKMRNQHIDDDRSAQFCYVCKYLIVNRVNPNMLQVLDWEYPKAGKNG
jgi:hypothetical protein